MNRSMLLRCVITRHDRIDQWLRLVGSGAEGTVEGAHVVNSTQQMSRSIADVYAVRSDWYEANKPWVNKFVAGYLKGTEDIGRHAKEL